ncbi:MAG: TrbI/VirB10 family protein [Pseudomonadota bacterium]
MSEQHAGRERIEDETLPDRPLAVPDPAAARRRQQAVMAVAGVALFAVVMAGMWLAGAGPSSTGDTAEITSKQFHVPGQSLNEREAWMAGGEVQIKEHESQLKELQQWKEQQEQRQKEADVKAASSGLTAPPSAAPSSTPLMSAFTTPPVLPTASASNGAARLLPPGTPPRPLRSEGTNAPGTPDGGGQPVESGSGILHISLAAPRAADNAPRGEEGRDTDRAVPKQVGTYLPAGSITSAVLLGGLDAPTGGQAQSNPHPVVLQLRDNSILPNRFRARTKECHVVGAGFGDISSERAYIRTETLSCVLRNGQVLEIPIKGYVAGEDGKTGIRGRVVKKDGQLLAMALIAGLGSGFGQALAQTATTVSISPLGATQTVDPSKVFERGAYSGVGRALDRLAQYYISLAEKTFPIVEVAAGRTVEVVMTGGVLLDADINKLAAAGGLDETDEEEFP